MPCTPESSTSSAERNASISETPTSPSCSSRSLGMTISVSHSLRSAVMPSSACPARRRPSKVNGRVTTPIVSAPSLRAIDATTGAPPVPVPPPSPAVTKTMSAPLRTSSISSRWSSAALRPTSGFAPAPRPRVSSRPMSSLTSASDISRAWASVFTAMNSTPLRPDLDHPVDGVDAAATDADDLDHGQVVVRGRHARHLPVGLGWPVQLGRSGPSPGHARWTPATRSSRRAAWRQPPDKVCHRDAVSQVTDAQWADPGWRRRTPRPAGRAAAPSTAALSAAVSGRPSDRAVVGEPERHLRVHRSPPRWRRS